MKKVIHEFDYEKYKKEFPKYKIEDGYGRLVTIIYDILNNKDGYELVGIITDKDKDRGEIIDSWCMDGKWRKGVEDKESLVLVEEVEEIKEFKLGDKFKNKFNNNLYQLVLIFLNYDERGIALIDCETGIQYGDLIKAPIMHPSIAIILTEEDLNYIINIRPTEINNPFSFLNFFKPVEE